MATITTFNYSLYRITLLGDREFVKAFNTLSSAEAVAKSLLSTRMMVGREYLITIESVRTPSNPLFYVSYNGTDFLLKPYRI